MPTQRLHASGYVFLYKTQQVMSQGQMKDHDLYNHFRSLEV